MFELIQNSKLNIKAFKEFFPNLDWIKAPRSLTSKHVDYFYIGKYEDEYKKVKIVIRPSGRMAITESLKNRDINTGEIPKKNSAKVGDWGTYLEVIIDEKVLEKVREAAKTKPKMEKQTITW